MQFFIIIVVLNWLMRYIVRPVILNPTRHIVLHMANNTKIIMVAGAALLAVGIIGATIFTLKSEAPSPNGVSERQAHKKKHNIRIRKNRKGAERHIQTPKSLGREKPNLLEDLDDEAKLTAAELALLNELQDGVDRESFRDVVKTVEKIQKMIREKGFDGVPVALRAEAVEALGWFTPDSLAELLGFMADTDPDVLDDVMTKFEDAIDDAELGDRALSEILKSVAKVLDNEEALDALFMGIESDMRNSVAVATYKEIIKTGSDAAKSRVWESIEDFTGEDDIKTIEQLDEWLKENPDDEDDEDFFGPDKEEPDDDAAEPVTPKKK